MRHLIELPPDALDLAMAEVRARLTPEEVTALCRTVLADWRVQRREAVPPEWRRIPVRLPPDMQLAIVATHLLLRAVARPERIH